MDEDVDTLSGIRCRVFRQLVRERRYWASGLGWFSFHQGEKQGESFGCIYLARDTLGGILVRRFDMALHRTA